MAENIEERLKKLERLSLHGLRDEWRRHFSESPPTCQSPGFVRRLLAFKLQEKAFGPPAPEISHELRQLKRTLRRNSSYARNSSLDLKPGTILAREWKGSLRRVHVLSDGFEFEGERFQSLSEVARKITGTRWSGPLFFGLKKPNPK